MHINHTLRQSQEKLLNTKQTHFVCTRVLGSGEVNLLDNFCPVGSFGFLLLFFLERVQEKKQLSARGGREDRRCWKRNNVISVYYTRFKIHALAFF